MPTTLTKVLSAKKTAILAVMQPIAGTFVMPTAANYLQVRNVTLEPLSHNVLELNEVCARLGSRMKSLSAQQVKLTFEAVMRGPTPPGKVPNIGNILRMCGFSETIDATLVKSTYTPVDSGFESGSIVAFIDGNKHAIAGAKGKLSAEWKANDFPIFKVELVGLYVDPVYEANPNTACYAAPMPLEINKANTTWELHNITTALYSASIDIATNPELIDVPGQQSVEITDRVTSGQIEFAASQINDKNWFNAVRANDAGVLNITHGTTAGNIVECVAHNVQLLNPKYGDQNSRRSISCDLNLMPTAVANQFEVAFIFR